MQSPHAQSATLALRERWLTLQKTEDEKHHRKMRFRPKREDQKRTRKAVAEVTTTVGNEYMRQYLVKEASVQTLPTSDEVFENWEDWTEFTPEPIQSDDQDLSIGRYADAPPPMISNYQEASISVQTSATTSDHDDDVDFSGTSMLNPRVAAVATAFANSPHHASEESSVHIDFHTFDKYILQDSEPFPDVTQENARKLVQEVRFQELYTAYVDATRISAVGGPGSSLRLRVALSDLLSFIAGHSDQLEDGIEVEQPVLFFSNVEKPGRRSRASSQKVDDDEDLAECISVNRTIEGVPDPRSGIELFFYAFADRDARGTSATSFAVDETLRSGQKRKRGSHWMEIDDPPASEPQNPPTKKSRNEDTPSDTPNPQPPPISYKPLPPPEISIRLGERPPAGVLDMVEAILEVSPSRRHILAVVFEELDASFHFFDRAGCITSQKIPLLDVQFVAAILRMVSGDRRLAGFEPFISGLDGASVVTSSGTSSLRMKIGGTHYGLIKTLTSEQLAWPRFTHVYLAHALQHPPELVQPEPVLLKISWQLAQLPREDILLRHAMDRNVGGGLDICDTATPIRLSDGVRGQILPGGVDKLYRDLELRVLVLRRSNSFRTMVKSLSLRALREILPGMERVAQTSLRLPSPPASSQIS